MTHPTFAQRVAACITEETINDYQRDGVCVIRQLLTMRIYAHTFLLH